MISRRVLLCSILILIFVVPAGAHVPVIVGDNNNINTAMVIDIPQKTYVFYGSLQEAHEVAYYRLVI
jgi:hypothetical protein